MGQTTYSDVFSVSHDPSYEEVIQVGDIVRTGPNLFPHYTVVAVVGEKSWVRNIQTGADGITNTVRCRKINGAPALAV